jgi:putative glutamine amidotransferase
MIAIVRCHGIHDYEESIRRAGGDGMVIEPGSQPVEDVIAAAQGLLLTGGGDVDPSLYGAAAHATYSPAEQGRDEFEIALVNRAIEARLPILAICRGVQVLNVARGGSLVQDIPSELSEALTHRFPVPPNEAVKIAHDVWVERDSLLGRLLTPHLEEDDTCGVNSRHHQALQRLGQGLVVAATAPDGVIEAVEAPEHPFCLGVQWHPENFYRTGEFRELFEGLLQASRR